MLEFFSMALPYRLRTVPELFHKTKSSCNQGTAEWEKNSYSQTVFISTMILLAMR